MTKKKVLDFLKPVKALFTFKRRDGSYMTRVDADRTQQDRTERREARELARANAQWDRNNAPLPPTTEKRADGIVATLFTVVFFGCFFLIALLYILMKIDKLTGGGLTGGM